MAAYTMCPHRTIFRLDKILMRCLLSCRYLEKVPEAMEALNTLEYIFVLQQAGKDAAMEREFDVEIPWPEIKDVWPPTKYKLNEARKAVTAKAKGFFFRASIHP